VTILLFIVYVLLIIVLFKTLPFFKYSGINFKWLTIIFIAKLMAGFAYAFIHQYFYVDADALAYVNRGKILHSYYYENRAMFFKLCFGPNGYAPSAYLKTYVQPLSFWHDTSAFTLVRINALLSFVGFGNYYLHLIFWQFFGLYGLTALYKAFVYFFEDKKNLLLAGIFLAPSVVFWYSGIHKEAISICGIGFITLFVVKCHQRRFSFVLLFITLISITLLVFVRLYLFAIIIPTAIALYLSLNNKKVFAKYAFVYGLCAIALAILVFIKPSLNPINEFVATQQYFEKIGAGNAEMKIPKLEPSIWSLVKNSPTAFFSTLLRPSLLDVSAHNTVIKIFAGIETLLISLLLIASLYWGKWQLYFKHPIVVYVLCIVIFYYILLGLTIPNLGALCRYKSMVLPLLIPVLLLVLNFKKFPFSSLRNK